MKNSILYTFLMAVLFVALAAIVVPTDLVGQDKTDWPATEQVLEADQTIQNDAAPNNLIAQVETPDTGEGVAQENDTADDPQPSEEEGPTAFQQLWAWVQQNTAEAILAFLGVLKIITNLTPTDKDNRWYDIIENFFNAIFPNLKKGGGTHVKATT